MEARKLFDDAQAFLKEIIAQKLLKARAVIGFFQANSVGDDIIVYTDDSRKKARAVFHTLRQQTVKFDDKSYWALAVAAGIGAGGARRALRARKIGGHNT